MYCVSLASDIEKAFLSGSVVFQSKLIFLCEELKKFGPIRSDWPGFGFSPKNEVYFCDVTENLTVFWRIEGQDRINVFELSY